jgi:serpin B
MCYAAARNETASQLRRGLSYGEQPDERIYQLNGEFDNNLKSYSSVNMKTANHIFVQKDYIIKQNYEDLLKIHFKSGAESVDFSRSIETANKINNWVSYQTANRIKNLISPTMLNSLTKMVLVNAVYFKGNWANPFNSNDTFKEHFTLSNGTKKLVKMMTLTNKKLPISINPGGLKVIACELPYGNMSDVSMTIILPDVGVSLEEIERKMNPTTITSILKSQFEIFRVQAYLPKFKLRSKFEVIENEI